MRRLIMTGGNTMDIEDLARREGARDLRRSGLIKVKQGVTSGAVDSVCSRLVNLSNT
ncbi:MAG: hypothetical protein MZW92_66145 [Comamonadaceae bacterium]|nr:hypothetical protein [Comamonadaceae bacterium]